MMPLLTGLGPVLGSPLVLRLLTSAGLAVGALVLFSLWGWYISIRPPRITSSVTPSRYGLAYDNVTLTTDDGIRLAGWFIPATGRETKATLVLLHGYPADKGNILPELAFLAEDFNLLLLDFRYFGESGGSYSTIGAKEVKDLSAAVHWLDTRGLTTVGVWGLSLGGAVALMGAAELPNIRAVVADSAYANLGLMASELYPFPLLRRPLAALTLLWGRLLLGLDANHVSPAQAARRLKIPVLLIHSRADQTIPFNTHALALKAALAGNAKAEFWFMEELIHGELDKRYAERVRTFFRAHLR